MQNLVLNNNHGCLKIKFSSRTVTNVFLHINIFLFIYVTWFISQSLQIKIASIIKKILIHPYLLNLH